MTKWLDNGTEYPFLNEAHQSEISSLNYRLDQARERLLDASQPRKKKSLFGRVASQSDMNDMQTISAQKDVKILEKKLNKAHSSHRQASLKQLDEVLKQGYLSLSESNGSEFEGLEQQLQSVSRHLMYIYTHLSQPCSQSWSLIEPFLVEQMHKIHGFAQQDESHFLQALERERDLIEPLKAGGRLEPQEKLQLLGVSKKLHQFVARFFRLQSPTSNPIPEGEQPFQVAAFDTQRLEKPRGKVRSLKKRPAPKKGFTVDVQFDVKNKRTIVQQQASVMSEAKSYEELILDAYHWIDDADASAIQEGLVFQQSFECFMAARALNDHRFEAYLGLGYLYSLVGNRERAIYFIELASRATHQHPLVEELREKIVQLES